MRVKDDRRNDAPRQGGDAADMAASAIKRMNVRSTIMGWISMILWLMVAAGVAAYTWFYVTYINPILFALVHYSNTDVPRYEEQVGRFFHVLPTIVDITVVSAYAWAGLVVLAAACTLLYVRASRQATLRQIHLGLAEISEQLKRLSSSEAAE